MTKALNYSNYFSSRLNEVKKNENYEFNKNKIDLVGRILQFSNHEKILDLAIRSKTRKIGLRKTTGVVYGFRLGTKPTNKNQHLIDDVTLGSVADQAGIKNGNVLISVNQIKVDCFYMENKL